MLGYGNVSLGVVASDLKDLAERYDPASRNRYLSVYADLADPRHDTILRRRRSEVLRALAHREDREAFESAWETVEPELTRLRAAGGSAGAAIFSAPEHGFVRSFGLAAPVATRLVLDASPYVRPLARFVDEYEPFALVLLDGSRAALYSVVEGRPERAVSRELHLIGRHKKGGMSQMRYQRHRRGAVLRFYDDVAMHLAELLREEPGDRVVVAGPGTAKTRFVARLPSALRARVIAVEDADFGNETSDVLVRRFVELARAEEARSSQEAVEALRTELLSGELALTGPYDVARAAHGGRVELLVVQKEAVAAGAKCEAHQEYFAPGSRCHCGQAGSRVDLINEAVEAGIRTEATIEFADRADPFLEGLGGIAAILRW